jgi:hypothetical protein
MGMTNELMTGNERKPLTATEIKAQVQLIQEVMKAVMEKDVHYGIIPGTPKPTLYKPGAEKLLATFHIGADPSANVEDLSNDDEIRYRVAVKGFRQATGDLLGVGIGECSSSEEKYKWRKPVCDAEFDETPTERKRIAWKKGAQGPYQQKQIRMNPSDVANTILKMAKKRALVDMTLTITAASDIFDQDLEDLPEGMEVGTNGKPPLKEPQKKQVETPKKDTQTIITAVTDVTQKDGVSKDKKPFTRYTVHVGETKYGTFSKTVAEDAKRASQGALNVTIEYKPTQYGPEIVTLVVQEPPDEDNVQ